MTQLSQWLSSSLRFTPGTLGGIKVDGTAFHHGGFYPGYTTGALGAVGSYIGFTLDTPYQITPQGRTIFRLALESMRNYCNWQEWALSLGGRHPFSGKWRNRILKLLPCWHWPRKRRTGIRPSVGSRLPSPATEPDRHAQLFRRRRLPSRLQSGRFLCFQLRISRNLPVREIHGHPKRL